MSTTSGVSRRGMCVLLVAMGFVSLPSAYGVTIEIDTPSELDMIGKSAPYPLDGDYVLAEDLDASSTETWNDGAGFDPIGNYDAADPSKAFTGTFDGQGHTISNLFINRPAETSVGLFGCVRGAGQVTGVRLKWASITGGQYVGGLVGRNEGTVRNCVVKGCTISADWYVGGVVGRNSGTIDECYATSEVTGTASFVGGIAGRNYGTIEQSSATGVITGNDGVGGLTGSNSGTIDETFAACWVIGGTGTNLGGLCGSNSSTVTDSFWNKDTSLVTTSAGGTGLAMKEMRTSAPYITAGWSLATWGIVEGDSYPYLLAQTTLNSISSIADLQLIGVIYPLDGDFVLTQNINAAVTATWDGGKGFNPIGGTSVELSECFTGRFYGQGHVISNLVMNRPAEYGTGGLFRDLSGGGEIVHLGLEDCAVTGESNLGGLTYRVSATSTVFGCHVTGSIIGDSFASSNIGGLIGINRGTACDSYVNCSCVENGNYGGGLTAHNDGVILRCHAGGSIDGDFPGAGSPSGGLVGANNPEGIIFACYATTMVNGSAHAGGLVGHNLGVITSSYASGTVAGSLDYVGGFVGTNGGEISDCCATGAATGDTTVGGLVGKNADGAVDTCWAAGSVVSISGINGGLIGSSSGSYSVLNSYWDTDTSGQPTSSGGTGLSTEDMVMADSFVGWNFVNDWGIDEGETYPYLMAIFPIYVTSPSGGEVWSPRSEHTITWTHAPDSGSHIKIKLFKGGVFNRWISGPRPNTGSFLWKVPADLPLAADYAVQIYSASDFSKINVSAAPFQIAAPAIEVISPNGGESWAPSSTHEITWDAWAGIGTDVKIKLFKGGVFNRWISGPTPNDGSFSWKMPADLPLGSNYEVQIYSATDFNQLDFSDAYFSITEPDVEIVYPNGGDRFLPGDPVTIAWTSKPGADPDVKLKLFKGGTFYCWISGPTPNDGAFSWTFPLDAPMGDDYTVQIYSATDFSQIDFSDAPFSVTPNRLRLVAPNGGQTWRIGTTRDITWNSAGTVGANIKLKLFKAGVFDRWISGPTPNDRVFSWTVPADLTPASDYTIQIYSATDLSIIDYSDRPFTIAAP